MNVDNHRIEQLQNLTKLIHKHFQLLINEYSQQGLLDLISDNPEQVALLSPNFDDELSAILKNLNESDRNNLQAVLQSLWLSFCFAKKERLKYLAVPVYDPSNPEHVKKKLST